MIGGRSAEGALQRCYTSIDGARAQAWHLGESILGSGTEGFAIGSGKWTSEATNQRIRIGIIDNGGGAWTANSGCGKLCRLKVSFSALRKTWPVDAAAGHFF